MYNWSTLKKLIWLYAAKLKGGASAIIETITGNLPLVLQNAIQQAIKSLTRYGLCTQDGTPTPGAPVDIMCNNGALKWDSVNQRVYADGTPEVLTVGGANLLNAATNITGYYIGSNGSITEGSDAQYTDLIPVKAGETYVCSFVSGRNSGTNRWHGYDANGTWVKQLAYVSASGQQGNKLAMIATIDSGISYVRLSYGLADTEAMIEKAVFSQQTDVFYKAKLSNGVPFIRDFGTPVQSPFNGSWKVGVVLEVTPGETYAVSHDVFRGDGKLTPYDRVNIGCYESTADVNDADKCLSHANSTIRFTVPNGAHYAVIEFEGSGPYTFSFVGVVKVDYQPYVAPQTATAENLLSVGTVKDEQDIISGAVTRKCGVCYYDGTQAIGDVYISTTGGKDNGAIIVYPLATPVTEQVTGQNLVTNDGMNIVDSVANVSPLTAEVKYVAASAQDVLSTLLGMKVTRKDISTQDAEDMINIITGEDNNK